MTSEVFLRRACWAFHRIFRDFGLYGGRWKFIVQLMKGRERERVKEEEREHVAVCLCSKYRVRLSDKYSFPNINTREAGERQRDSNKRQPVRDSFFCLVDSFQLICSPLKNLQHRLLTSSSQAAYRLWSFKSSVVDWWPLLGDFGLIVFSRRLKIGP